MIDYAKIAPGDKLMIVGMGAPGFASLGDIVEVVSTNGKNRCDVKRKDGETAYFALTCGASRLAPAKLITTIDAKPPYPFCRTPEKCAGKGYCPADIATTDADQ